MEKLKSCDYRYLHLMLSERYAVLQFRKAKLNLNMPSKFLSNIDGEMNLISNILDSFEESDFSDD